MASLLKTDKVSATAGGAQEFTLPTADGTSGQFIKTNGSGVLSFADAGGGGKVLQVIHVTDTGVGDTTTSSTYVNTSTTGSITCSATTSKVFVIINGSSTGYRAVSYTHLTLPTNREV